MKVKNRISLLVFIVVAIFVVQIDVSLSHGVTIGFETSEGYVVGALEGQPTIGNVWEGVNSQPTKIEVTDDWKKTGSQSVVVRNNTTTLGKDNDYIDVGTLPTQFKVVFYWRPSTGSGGAASFYLSQTESISTGIGPWIQFAETDDLYQIKYVDGGFVFNIKLGMDRVTYQNQDWEIKIIGDLSTHTFDFYFDGNLEKQGIGFRHENATSLNYMGLQASTNGTSQHYFDDFFVGGVLASVSGRVNISIAGHTDLPVRNATVSLEGTGFATTSDTSGDFMIEGLAAGTYTLVIESPGLVPISQDFTVAESESRVITLAPMEVYKQGDADGDGKLGLEDVIYILRVLANVSP